MRSQRFVVVALLAGVAALAALEARRADAIPAFARKYQLSCSTCHAPFPRLKPYGEEFAGRGFRMEDASKEPSRATWDVGDPLLKLSRDIPLALRMDFYPTHFTGDDSPDRSDFETPWVVKLLSGGPITDRVSYYVYGILEEGESVKLEDTYLQFSSIFDLPVDLLVGQFQVCDPLFKRELRLERNDYAILKTRVGSSPTNLAYDRGLVLAWHAPAGVEVIAQVVNGNGIDAAHDGAFDDNTFKNTSLRVVRQFGPVRAGIFGYLGEAGRADVTNRITYIGPDLVVDLGEKWQLNLEFLERRDDNPYLAPPGDLAEETVTRGGFAELHFFPQGQDGRWAISALYNKIESDDQWTPLENASITVSYLIARNLRLMGEVMHDLDADNDRLTLGLVTAF